MSLPVCSAASRASTQKLLSIVFDNRHEVRSPSQ